MKLPGYVIQIILTLLFFVGAAARFSATDESTTPYFKGASAMNYRHAMEVADGGELDRLTNKAAWPEGYKPARYRASGVEYAAGYAFRAIRYFGEVDGRRFIRRLVVFLFSLCVVTLYVFTKNLWDCQAAGLIAAFFVAVFPPLVAATNGREFSHVPFGVFLATVHLALLLHHRRRHSLVPGVLSAVVAFLMLAVWELAPYYVAACALYITLAGGYSHGERTWLATGHALALVAASFALPHLEALSMIACWPTLLAVSCAGVAATGNRLGSFWKRAAVIAGACVALTVALTPVRLGATENIPVLRYLFYRMRFLTGPPESPQLIPDSIRGLWSAAHAPPSTHTLITFFLPLCMLAAAALVYARSKDVDRRKLATTFAVAVLGALVWCVDRSTTVVATVAILPCVAVAGRGVSSALFPRGLLIAGGAALALLDLVFPLSAGNPAFAIARARGVAGRDPHRFVWVSTVNTDLELVRFVSTRTSTRDPMLGPSDVTALLLAFSGRTSVALTGALSEGATARSARLESLFYGDEAQMQRECTEMGVSYVLYSVDYLLDTSRYSRRYLAGYSSIDPAAVIWKMHFAPHELEHFALTYENDHYRLFQVVTQPSPAFITDHPPVYQSEPFAWVDEDIDAFRQLTNELLITYSEAMRQHERRSYGVALNMLDWCLERAPRFTLARIAAAETLMRTGRLEEAQRAILLVIQQAPDNPRALYSAAYILAQLDESERAKGMLQVFYTTAKDPDLIARGRLLESFLERGISVVPGAPIPTDTTAADTTLSP